MTSMGDYVAADSSRSSRLRFTNVLTRALPLRTLRSENDTSYRTCLEPLDVGRAWPLLGLLDVELQFLTLL